MWVVGLVVGLQFRSPDPVLGVLGQEKLLSIEMIKLLERTNPL